MYSIYIPASVYNDDKSLGGGANFDIDKVLNLIVVVNGCQAVIRSLLKHCVAMVTIAVIYNSNFLKWKSCHGICGMSNTMYGYSIHV